MKPIRILVTGAGSGVGQSIIKALKLSKINIKQIRNMPHNGIATPPNT